MLAEMRLQEAEDSLRSLDRAVNCHSQNVNAKIRNEMTNSVMSLKGLKAFLYVD